MDIPTASLDELRRRIDALDDRLQDMLLERADLVTRIAALKQSAGVPALRPGREAQILRRLAARHHGPFPRQSLVRLWRELLGGMTTMQGRFAVAVMVPEGRPGFWDLARDHFGSQVAMVAWHAPDEVLAAIDDGRAAVGVLPLPHDRDPAPWWPALAAARAGSGPRVLARLPFAGRGNARDTDSDSLVIGRAELDPTGDDRSMLVVKTTGDVSRSRLTAALETAGRKLGYLAGFKPASGGMWHLVEFDDVVLPEDGRLAAALKPLGDDVREVGLFGIYARPLPPEPR